MKKMTKVEMMATATSTARSSSQLMLDVMAGGGGQECEGGQGGGRQMYPGAVCCGTHFCGGGHMHSLSGKSSSQCSPTNTGYNFKTGEIRIF